MSRKGMSCDNARAEGFFGLLKQEFYYPRDWSGTTVGGGVHGRAGPLDGVVSVGTHLAEAGLADTGRYRLSLGYPV